MDNILAVINNWSDANRIVEKASLMTAALGCEVVLYCPVSNAIEEMNRYIGFANYESMRDELVSQSRIMVEELEGVEKFDVIVEWQAVPYKAVLEKAEALGSRMIIISASEHSIVGDLLHKTDDHHLIRDAHCPIWILGAQGYGYRRVTVAIDALNEDEMDTLNGRVLDQAEAFSRLYDLPLKVVSVVPDPSRLFSELTVADNVVMADFRQQAKDRIAQRQQHLLALYGCGANEADVVIGQVEKVLQSILSKDGLLVLGSVARKGMKGFFLGNTAERLLSHLDGDMLVVN